MGEESKVGGGMSLGEMGLLALQNPNFSKSNGVARRGLCWGRIEIQQCCLALCGSRVLSDPWGGGSG